MDEVWRKLWRGLCALVRKSVTLGKWIDDAAWEIANRLRWCSLEMNSAYRLFIYATCIPLYILALKFNTKVWCYISWPCDFSVFRTSIFRLSACSLHFHWVITKFMFCLLLLFTAEPSDTSIPCLANSKLGYISFRRLIYHFVLFQRSWDRLFEPAVKINCIRTGFLVSTDGKLRDWFWSARKELSWIFARPKS